MSKNDNKGNNMLAVIDARIDAIGKSEAVTKLELGMLSRELLLYVPDSKDIGRVNRLLDVLNGGKRQGNRKMAVLFFTAFLPWKYDNEGGHFGGMIKGDTNIAKKLVNATEFLKDDKATIWTWAERNIVTEEREKDYGNQITNLVKRALEDDKYAIDKRKVIQSVIAGGVSMFELMTMIEAAKVAAEEEAKALAAANANQPKVEGQAPAEAPAT